MMLPSDLTKLTVECRAHWIRPLMQFYRFKQFVGGFSRVAVYQCPICRRQAGFALSCGRIVKVFHDLRNSRIVI
jgi:hypothetical protein